jgi:uncharacterized membrane protein
MRRTVSVLVVGLAATLALLSYAPWELAIVAGWDAAAATFLGSVWHLIVRSDGPGTERLAAREDDTHTSATLLLVAVSTASLLGVGFVLGLAGDRSGALRATLITAAVATVALSWSVINTIYTLRYAHLYYGRAADGIEFNMGTATPPSYRDFVYLAFTVGMTYQVSDTALSNPQIRRTVLWQAILAYLFGVVIVAGAINLMAGLVG